MPQNRKNLIDLFIGNMSTAVFHEILVFSAKSEEITKHYEKEIDEAINNSKRYREKINPADFSLPSADIGYIKAKIELKVKAELNSRIRKGYKNIDLTLVEPLIKENLEKMKVT